MSITGVRRKQAQQQRIEMAVVVGSENRRARFGQALGMAQVDTQHESEERAN